MRQASHAKTLYWLPIALLCTAMLIPVYGADKRKRSRKPRSRVNEQKTPLSKEQNAYKKKVDKLDTQYNQALARLQKSLDEKIDEHRGPLISALKTILKEVTQKGNIEEASRILDIIKQIQNEQLAQRELTGPSDLVAALYHFDPTTHTASGLGPALIILLGSGDAISLINGKHQGKWSLANDQLTLRWTTERGAPVVDDEFRRAQTKLATTTKTNESSNGTMQVLQMGRRTYVNDALDIFTFSPDGRSYKSPKPRVGPGYLKYGELTGQYATQDNMALTSQEGQAAVNAFLESTKKSYEVYDKKLGQFRTIYNEKLAKFRDEFV